MGKLVKAQAWQEEARNFPAVSVKEKDLKKRDTDWYLKLAKVIIKTTDDIKNGVENAKQRNLGELFNAASLAVKLGNGDVKIKDIYVGLGISKSMFNTYIDFYTTETDFKEMLSFGGSASATKLPNYSVNRELIGDDSQEKFEFYNSCVEWNDGDEPTRDKVREYKKHLKGEVAKVVAPTAVTPIAEPIDEGISWDEAIALYEKATGINVDKMEEEVEASEAALGEVKLTTDIYKSLQQMEKSKFKVMYKQVAKCLHPDLGGDAEMMSLWKLMAKNIENGFDLIEYQGLKAEYYVHFEAVEDIAEKGSL